MTNPSRICVVCQLKPVEYPQVCSSCRPKLPKDLRDLHAARLARGATPTPAGGEAETRKVEIVGEEGEPGGLYVMVTIVSGYGADAIQVKVPKRGSLTVAFEQAVRSAAHRLAELGYAAPELTAPTPPAEGPAPAERTGEHWNARLIREEQEAHVAWGLPAFIRLSHAAMDLWGWSCRGHGICPGLAAKGYAPTGPARAAIAGHLASHHATHAPAKEPAPAEGGAE